MDILIPTRESETGRRMPSVVRSWGKMELRRSLYDECAEKSREMFTIRKR